MKTYMANPDKIERKWYVVDAEGLHIRTSGIRSSKSIKRKEQTGVHTAR